MNVEDIKGINQSFIVLNVSKEELIIENPFGFGRHNDRDKDNEGHRASSRGSCLWTNAKGEKRSFAKPQPIKPKMIRIYQPRMGEYKFSTRRP